MKKVFLVATTIFVTVFSLLTGSISTAHALNSGPFYFKVGVVNPNSKLDIRLTTELPMGRYYRIACDIYNPSYNKPYPVVLNMRAAANNSRYVTNILLNDKKLNADQGILDKEYNKYVIPSVVSSAYPIWMEFINYDTTDT